MTLNSNVAAVYVDTSWNCAITERKVVDSGDPVSNTLPSIQMHQGYSQLEFEGTILPQH